MKNNSKGILFVLLSAISFATAGVLIKSVSWGSLSLNGARCVFAFAVMAAYMKITHHRFVFNKAVLLGAVANFAMCITFVSANKLTSAANAIVLQFTMPAFIIVFLAVFWKQKPDRLQVITVAASFVGICFFFLESLTEGGTIGNLIAVLSGALYAVVFLIKKIPNADFESSVLVSYALSMVAGAPFVFQEQDFSARNLIFIAVMGIIQMGLSFIFLNLGLSQVQPVAASLISMIEPILNPILVAIVYGETIGVIALAGAVIVLGSATVYNVLLAKRQNDSPENER